MERSMSAYPIEFKNEDLSLEEQLEQDPQVELISISDTTKVYYDKNRGMYLVLFLSTGEWCIFDEY